MTFLLAIDTGGTFTDLALYDTAAGRFHTVKSLTSYDDFVRGLKDCLAKSGADLDDTGSVKFGTTLVINTFVQRNGARTALVATKGFRDVLETRRGNRTFPFDLRFRWDAPLAPRELAFELAERIGSRGEVLHPLDPAEVEALAAELARPESGVEAVAVALLNAYANDAHERQVAEVLSARLPGVFVTRATELSRQYYEYERTSTAVANAYAGPRFADYLGRLRAWLDGEAYGGARFMLASHGGVYPFARAAREPLMLVESGPVGGCIGAAAYASALGLDRLIAFDMGGTTAKCCVIKDGRFEIKTPYDVGGPERGFPIQCSVVDIVEVGAGGGSIAAVDPQGRLSVGPRSAGSYPGPACYGRGGTEPTVTDANAVLGRIGGTLIGGEMAIDAAAAQAAVRGKVAHPMGLADASGLDRAADGILQISVLLMADAVKQITSVRGMDPRDFALFVYGGSGPLHASRLARELGLGHVVVPLHPGAFASIGMLMAHARLEEQMSLLRPLSDTALPAVLDDFAALETRLGDSFRKTFGDLAFSRERQADLRHVGQGHTLRITLPPEADAARIATIFHEVYRERYGHANPESALEFVGLTVIGVGDMEVPPLQRAVVDAGAGAGAPEPKRRSVYFAQIGRTDAPVYARAELQPGFTTVGPAVVEEYGSSTLLEPGDRLEVGAFGELHIFVPKDGQARRGPEAS